MIVLSYILEVQIYIYEYCQGKVPFGRAIKIQAMCKKFWRLAASLLADRPEFIPLTNC